MHSPAFPRLIQEVATDQQRDLENNPNLLWASKKWNLLPSHPRSQSISKDYQNRRTQQNHNTFLNPNRGTTSLHSQPPSPISNPPSHLTMFATQPIPSSPSTPFRQTSHYIPARPSPLGPRSSNIATPPWTMTSPSRAGHPQKPVGHDENSHSSPISFPNFTVQTEQPQRHHNPVSSDTHSQSQSPSFVNIASSPAPFTFNTSAAFTSTSQHQQQQPNIFTPTSPSPTSPTPSTRPRYAERYATQIANPMRSTTSLARSKTRKMFLNRVKNERDTGRFEARGEQMMMAEYLADKRRWEESMARDVDRVLRGVEGDIEDDGMLPGTFCAIYSTRHMSVCCGVVFANWTVLVYRRS